MSSEVERIALLRDLLAATAPGVLEGIGDDAAVLAPPGGNLVWTVDQQNEGVHFRFDLLKIEDLGWRATMAAASDVAAMGARPWCVLACVALPRTASDADLEALGRGQAAAARALGAPIVGGNLSRAGAWSVTTTVLGTAARPVRRAGATPGDGVWVAGRLGLAGAGLGELVAGRTPSVAAAHAWRRPVARIADGLAMAGLATAAIDVSDGFARDLGALVRAGGVAAVLDGPALEKFVSKEDHVTLELVCSGGEDYALVCSSTEPIAGFVRVGTITRGKGVRVRDAAGEHALEPRGFDHFGGPP